MKRLVDGVTYNTDTATVLACSDYEGDWNNIEGLPIEGFLYQTRGGAFFLVEYITLRTNDKSEEADDDGNVYKVRFLKMSDAAAREWINTGEVDVSLNPFEDKVDEEETEGTVYVRLPAALKRKIEASAAAENLSANAWAMRCFEKCLAA